MPVVSPPHHCPVSKTTATMAPRTGRPTTASAAPTGLTRHPADRAATAVRLSDVLKGAVAPFAFHASLYPLILVVQCHCSEKQQREAARLIKVWTVPYGAFPNFFFS